MGRSPCCDESGGNVKKGPWTPEEDEKLIDYINKNGHGSWRTLAKRAGLNRCGKSCRLRWANYLRPDIKRGKFTQDEERIIINLHSVLGNKWSKIATHLPGRTDNEIKNFWNTHIRKKLLQMGIDPETHKPRTDLKHLMNLTQLLGMSSNLGNPMMNMMNTSWGANPNIGLQGDVTQLAQLHLLQNMLQIMNSNTFVNMGNNNNPNFPFGNPSFSSAYLNGLNTIQGVEPFGLKSEEYGSNPSGLSSQSNYLFQDGLPNTQELELCNKLINTSATSHENHQAEINSLLPALVAASSPVTGGTCSSSMNQMENNNNSSCCNASAPTSTAHSPNDNSNTIFDDLEKLLQDDETCASYWKDILDLTSTSASANYSW